MIPHLFIRGDEEFSACQAAAETTHRARFARLLEQADSYLTYLPPAEHPSATITYIGMAVANLAFAFRLTGDERYLTRAREWIKVAVGYPHWGRAHMPDHDLDAGWLLFGLGLGYEWLREYLPEEERDAMCAKLLLQGTRLYDFAVETEGTWWSSAYWQNHNWICYAGLATAAFALEGEHPATCAWSTRAVENFRSVLSLMPEDGSDYEGPVYWCYGFPWLLIAADVIKTGTGVDLHGSEFLRNTFYYRLYSSGPNLVDTANFGDCHDRRSAHASAIYYRLASVYRDGHAQWLAEEFERSGEWARERKEGLLLPSSASHAFLEFLWYDPTVKSEPIDRLACSRAFPDLGLVSARTDWSPEATYLAFKCGTPSGEKAWVHGNAINRQRGWRTLKGGHAHPDENSFILIHGADYLAVDEGYSQKKQSSHHNVVLVDGKGQYREGVYDVSEGLGAEWGGKLESHFAGGEVAYMRGEAARAYDPELGLERFTRQMVFGGEFIVMCDDLAASEAREFTWLLQSDVPFTCLDEKRFQATVGRSRLLVSAFEPAGLNTRTLEQEVVAYPSASTPEWVLRHTQNTLVLAPARTSATRFLVALGIGRMDEPFAQLSEVPCRGGSAIGWATGDTRTAVAFARGARGVGIDGVLETDARWMLASWRGDKVLYCAAGDVTRLSVGGQLLFASTEPTTLEMHRSSWRVVTRAPAGISIWSSSPAVTAIVNERHTSVEYDALLSMVRTSVQCGETEIRIGEQSGQ